MLVGADTGRDGIHGATFACVAARRVVGGAAAGGAGRQPVPREAADGGVRGADGGARRLDRRPAGPAARRASPARAVECAAKAAPASISTWRRCRGARQGMTPYEVMLSESQERMLVIVEAGARGRRPGALRALGAALRDDRRRHRRRRSCASTTATSRSRACRRRCSRTRRRTSRGREAGRGSMSCRRSTSASLPDIGATRQRQRAAT